MPIEVTMPKLSPTMETGVIAQWLKKVGDTVKEGDVLADIETDKATMPMKSYDDGTIVHIDHAAGDEVALGQRVLVLAKKGEDPKQIAEKLGAWQATKRPPRCEKPRPGARSGRRQRRQRPATRLTMASKRRPPSRLHAAGGRVKASPLARKVAAASSVDIGRVPGTGPGGRIIRRDVEHYLQKKPQARAAPGQAAATTPPAHHRSTPPPLAAQRIPHSRMRKTIAQRMSQAKQTAPEIHLSADVRADRIVAARAEINKHLAAEGIKVSSATSSPRPSRWRCGSTRV